MPDYMPKSARPYMPRSARPVSQAPEVGAGETLLNRAVNAVPLGRILTDFGTTAVMQGAKALGVGEEGATLTPQAKAELQVMGEEVDTPKSTIPDVVDTYRQARDTRAARDEAGGKQNPWAARVGTGLGIGLSMLAPLPKASGTGLRSSVTTGAGYGALEGLTNGRADLTRGDFAGALRDTAEGAALGAGAGALGHGLVRLGQRGLQALRNARGELVSQETAALREAAQEGQDQLAKEVAAHREVVGKARGMMRKDFAQREAAAADEAAALERQHGQALEANRRVDARSARDAARAVEKERNLVGQARELNKRFDARRADELEQQIADIERAAEAERKMIGQAREMDKVRASRAAREQGQAVEMNKARDLKDRNMVGSAREMNKRRDVARARQLLQQARERAEPSTRVLEGYAGKAGERKAVNYDRVQQYRRDIHNPDMDTRASSDLQRYIEEYGDAVDAPDAFRRRFIERYLRENHGDEMAERLMRERVSPDGRSILPRPAPAAAPAPSLADEAEAAMAARRAGAAGSDVERGMAPMLPAPRPASLDTWTPNAPRPVAEPVLAAPPARRGSSPAFDVGGRPPPGFEQARTRPGGGAVPQEPSMAAPVAEPLPEAATRATSVPNLRRPALPPAPEPTVVGAPAVRAAPPPASDIQDVTRLSGPEDVAPLAQERAAAREAGAFGAIARAGYEGVKSGQSTLGAIVGGVGGITRETLKDPAVRARALSVAKLHLLAQINPELFARVGAQLSAAAATGDEGRYKAQKYLAIRTHPELRVAENQAAERAGRLSDEQLMTLIAGGAPGAP